MGVGRKKRVLIPWKHPLNPHKQTCCPINEAASIHHCLSLLITTADATNRFLLILCWWSLQGGAPVIPGYFSVEWTVPCKSWSCLCPILPALVRLFKVPSVLSSREELECCGIQCLQKVKFRALENRNFEQGNPFSSWHLVTWYQHTTFSPSLPFWRLIFALITPENYSVVLDHSLNSPC